MGDGRRPVVFEGLTDVSLRTAWPHEAHDFSASLAGNVERLSEAIAAQSDITEVPVG